MPPTNGRNTMITLLDGSVHIVKTISKVNGEGQNLTLKPTLNPLTFMMLPITTKWAQPVLQ